MRAAPEKGQASKRLFFALWPDPPVRQQLAELAHRACKHPVADAKLHMTLVFLGSRTAQERQCFSQMASEVQGEAFELHLDFLGIWPRPGIQWLGSSQPPRVLIEFVDKLQTALVSCVGPGCGCCGAIPQDPECIDGRCGPAAP